MGRCRCRRDETGLALDFQRHAAKERPGPGPFPGLLPVCPRRVGHGRAHGQLRGPHGLRQTSRPPQALQHLLDQSHDSRHCAIILWPAAVRGESLPSGSGRSAGLAATFSSMPTGSSRPACATPTPSSVLTDSGRCAGRWRTASTTPRYSNAHNTPIISVMHPRNGQPFKKLKSSVFLQFCATS